MDNVEIRTSSIEGFGVFAVRPFSAGQRIRQINVVREVTPNSPLREELGERADHCDYPNGKIVLLGTPDRHVNHSCDPNAYVLYKGDRSFLVARRDIAAGQEITCDYNINITEGTAWPCHCGLPGAEVGPSGTSSDFLSTSNGSTGHSLRIGSCVPIVIG